MVDMRELQRHAPHWIWHWCLQREVANLRNMTNNTLLMLSDPTSFPLLTARKKVHCDGR